MKETVLGELITESAGRDAIHVACAPMVADCELKPGEHVGIVRHGIAGKQEPFVGIVDPFLKENVLKGQRFWFVLYPKTVTGIRHHWTHPLFLDQDQLEDSQEFITTFASQWGYSFDEFMTGARDYVFEGSEMDDKYESADVSDKQWAMFWKHFQALTGLSIEQKTMEFVRCCPN